MVGDLKVSFLPSHNGVLFGHDRLCPFPSSPSPLPPASNPGSALISSDSWDRAEMTTRVILSKIQPTKRSHLMRMDIVKYVERLLGSHNYQVYPYGSVPLNTYLPDGDIDLTVLCPAIPNDQLAINVCKILREEKSNEAAQYKVKEIHFIDAAEVKLVKCIIQDIVVDISFNQLGGLTTFRFLVQVDHHLRKSHLFKRSLILIKAWCFYESRILGSQHGLLSTYALETMIIYVFHMFHTSLKGPLSVLYKFLDYFSKFDWENHCLSLKGPICKHTHTVVEVPVNDTGALLLSKEFLINCRKLFCISFDGLETDLVLFHVKHLDIIDPLKENNNLGRSVSRGNFYRICSALKLGARKLGWILSLSGERMTEELNKYFANTLNRQRVDRARCFGMQRVKDSEPSSSSHRASVKGQTYHLKDEDDFPPLSFAW
ncbi:uncharacterized protein LOC133788220 [Humulus lupulus]|uniref:uncharacterized protein LOC133788220 n=1 Tax=Humulus lupulus TaxID=3486 RepID=UPI002B402D68|nr:uncharacterized protein LOC133788220 [Humulus lupulus]XP_062081595.1 uncharacterized protein LOC133788220 [Humulus lupulus]